MEISSTTDDTEMLDNQEQYHTEPYHNGVNNDDTVCAGSDRVTAELRAMALHRLFYK